MPWLPASKPKARFSLAGVQHGQGWRPDPATWRRPKRSAWRCRNANSSSNRSSRVSRKNSKHCRMESPARQMLRSRRQRRDVLPTNPYIPADAMALSLAGARPFKAMTDSDGKPSPTVHVFLRPPFSGQWSTWFNASISLVVAAGTESRSGESPRAYRLIYL